jgi:ABC-type branched-subunit amino acid transport system substrate-binding protein
MERSRVRRVGALIAGLALVAAACGDDDDSGGGAATTGAPSPTEAPATSAAVPATSAAPGTTAAAEPGTTAAGGPGTTAAGGGGGELAGLKGTTPLVELSSDFTDRLLEIDPSLGTTFNYAAETYDAITIIALAVAEAGDDGIAYAEHINGITRGGEKCDSFEACMAIIDAGGDPDYDGVSGPIEFAGNGEPLQASYGLLTFGDNNRIDDSITEYIPATAPASADVPDTPVEGNRQGDGTLTIGSILPQTGSLAFLGPPEFAGMKLACNEINEAGGVLDKDIVCIEGDSGDATTDTANQTVDRLLSQDVDAIVGAASSGVSLTVIDKITGAGVVQFSPANTSKELSDYPDKGLYFRTAPSDILQGAVLGEVIAGDGMTTVGIIARNDSYGVGLRDDTTAALEEAGVEVVETQTYDEGAQTFDAEVQALAAANPDAVLVIAFDEASRIVTTMIENGIGPHDVQVYGTDGFIGNTFAENFEAGE